MTFTLNIRMAEESRCPAPGLGSGFCDVSVEGQPIDDGGDDPGVADHSALFGNGRFEATTTEAPSSRSLRISGRSDQPVPVRVGDRLGTISNSRLGEEMVYVALHGRLTDYQPGRNLGVGESGSDQLQHLGLACGETVG